MKPRLSVFQLKGAALAAAALFASAISSHAVWQLTWSDEFNGTTIDTSKWAFETGNNNGWGNAEREYYTGRTNNAYVANGLLHIVACQESTNGFPYTSARMKTQGHFSKQYGRIEFKAKLPQGLSYWPALWMLGNNITSVGWPACGEMDVMENNQSLGNQVQGTLHYSDTSNNHLQQTKVYALPTPGDSVTNFHTYAVEWTTNSIKWLVDSNLVQTWTSWSSSTGPYPAPYNQPFFLVMNVAVGGNYVGNPTDAQINAGTVFPGEMQVDWVRVYDDLPPTGPPSTPTGLNIEQGQAKAFANWDASTSGATGYIVRRATVSSGPWSIVGIAATNSYVDTGVSICTSYYYMVSATNSFGESTNSLPASVTLGAFATAVNSGGSASAQFSADTNFAGTVAGGTQAAPATATIDTSAVTSPAPQDVYQTERFGNFTYTFTNLTAGLNYKLRLHFAEIYWTSVGQRRFNVFINGTQVLTNFDIIAAAGAANKANIQEFTATPNSGQIAIQYVTVTDNAKSSGIEVLLPPPTPPAALSANAADSQVSLRWNPVTSATSYNVKRSPNAPGPYLLLAGNLATTNYTDSTVSNGSSYYYVVSSVRSGCESTNSAFAVATPLTPPPVSVTIQSSGGNFNVGWPTGTLQGASNLAGPWTDMGQTSTPSNLTVAPTGTQQFFRVKLR